jgi:hypothetical protein
MRESQVGLLGRRDESRCSQPANNGERLPLIVVLLTRQVSRNVEHLARSSAVVVDSTDVACLQSTRTMSLKAADGA